MDTSRRDLLKMGVALSAVPLVGGFAEKPTVRTFFSTGLIGLDAELGGGMAKGSCLAVVGPRGSGKTAFMLNLAKANGILDAHSMNQGTSDMLSIMHRTDGTEVGSLMLDAAEPSTDQEKQDMEKDPAARDAFLTRWFRRSREIVRESGGLFVISALGTTGDSSTPLWMSATDYIILADQSAFRLIKSPKV